MNKEVKHTPGPWIYVGGDNASVEVNIGKTTASIVRDCKNTGEYVIEREEMEANGRLIAAAPELLEALMRVVNMQKPMFEKENFYYDTATIIAQKAIEKVIP